MRISLYIPIWLYSNLESSLSMLLSTKTLHSNLVIFKCMRKELSDSSLQPLHSNLVIFKCLCFFAICVPYFLYIPIWLYSNGRFLTTYQSRHKPLHSNLVIFKWAVSQTLYRNLVFTFQSGYIQIKSASTILKVLLILYIPIWLYSNIKSV